MNRIGIFGGSFDPVHRGHLALASYACSELNLDKIYFVPSRQNPLKKNGTLLSGAFRVRLLKKAVHRYPKFSVSEIELKRNGVSYTVDTLRAFRKKFGKKTQLYFLSGSDSLRGFSRWKSPNEVLKLCRFVVLNRPGSPMNFHDERFLWLAMPPVDISSSGIRRKLKYRNKLRALGSHEVDRVLKNSLAMGDAGGEASPAVSMRRMRSKLRRK